MISITLRHINPQQDFALLAEWFTTLEGATNTSESLKEYYEKTSWRIREQVAEDEAGQVLGFYWAVRDEHSPEKAYLNLFVDFNQRKQGIGSQLMPLGIADARSFGANSLQAPVMDTDPAFKRFAEGFGFVQKRHSIGMRLDLAHWDDSSYDDLIRKLESEGFEFTSMQALGNTEEAQRQLYQLNNSATLDTPNATQDDGWPNFEAFQSSVCQQSWYNPAGQKVVIERASGQFVGMSAISTDESAHTAYNLFTGVARAFRGRGLATAVKVTALRFARDEMQIKEVFTHHNDENDPMIAIDRKLGYVQSPGTIYMVKELT